MCLVRMSFHVIRSPRTHQFAEKLSEKLGCLEPEWGMTEMESRERSVARADVVVFLIDENALKDAWMWSSTNEARLTLNMARDRQTKERIKLIQPVLCGITEDQYARGFSFRLPGLDCLTATQSCSKTDEDKEISALADEIRSRIPGISKWQGSLLLIIPRNSCSL